MRKTLSLLLCLWLSNAVPAQDLYDLNTVTVIELTFEQSNWDQLMDANYSNGNEDRLLASCIVNGIAFDSVGVKYKGNSTYNANNAKNPLNIKLDYTIGSQDYQGWYTLKLSNGDKDPSFVRETLSYLITRQYMHAPLCNYAKVYINDSYYGLFSSAESINKKFVGEHFYSDNDNPLFKCNATSNQYGGSSLSYLGTSQAPYEVSYEIQSDAGWPELMALTDAIENDPSNVEDILDIDRAIWMVAIDNVLVNLDSYISQMVQNYYLFYDDNSRFDCIKWDFNESFGRFGGGGGPGGGGQVNTYSLDPFYNFTDSSHPLLQLINNNPKYKRMYVAHCKTILEENFADNGYLGIAQSMQSVMQDAHETDPAAFFTFSQAQQNLTSSISTGGGPGGGNTVGITELMDARYDYLMALSDFSANAPTITNVTSDPTSVQPNSAATITADISDATSVYLGYRENAGQIFTKVTMYDDGNHNDGSANDGTYGSDIPVGASDIQYYIYAENSNAGKFSPARAEHEFHTLLVGGDVVINELMASNSTTAADQDGEYDDWVELYNRSNNTVDLTGFYLSDDDNDLQKWEFPSGTVINAGEYLIIWTDNDTLQAGLHTNFKLSASGEMVILSDGTTRLQEVTFGAQTTDLGYARVPNGTGPFVIQEPTFAANNDNLTGITEYETEVLSLFPNPTADYVYFNLDSPVDSKSSLKVYDLLGNLVLSTQLKQNNRISVYDLSAGTYILRTSNGQAGKFVKQ